jgi:hypothetical protein
MAKEYKTLNVFPDTNQKIGEIARKKGMLISFYIKFLVDEEYKKVMEV